jgi:hypothetical protein
MVEPRFVAQFDDALDDQPVVAVFGHGCDTGAVDLELADG